MARSWANASQDANRITLDATILALMIRIGFGEVLYHKYNKQPPQ